MTHLIFCHIVPLAKKIYVVQNKSTSKWGLFYFLLLQRQRSIVPLTYLKHNIYYSLIDRIHQKDLQKHLNPILQLKSLMRITIYGYKSAKKGGYYR